MNKQQAQQNIRRVYLFNFVVWFMVLIPVITPFFKSRGLNMQEIFELQALFAAVILLFEVPSGYLSDVWGRRKTLILAGAIEAVSAVFLIIAESYWGLALFEAFLAVGLSLRSGTDLSIVYDSIYAAEGRQGRQTKVLSTYLFVNSGSETLASLLGGFLATYNIEWAMWAFAVTLVLPLFIAFFIKEPPREKLQKHETWKNIKGIFHHLLISEQSLRLLFINGFFWGSSTFIMVWSYQHIWETWQIPMAWFGWLWAAQNLTVGLGGKWGHKLVDRWGLIPILWIIGLLPIVGFLGFSWVHGLWGLGFMFLFSLSRAFNGVAVRDALNMRIPSQFRATALSLSQMGMRLIFVLMGPAVGYGFDHVGIYNTMHILAVFYGLGFLFLLLPLIKVMKKTLS